jgi:uncharacterized protein with GYD domain
MAKYLATFTYSVGSWARMIESPGDRPEAVRKVMEALGGQLECMYWCAETEDGLTIADFPDSVAIGAVQAGLFKTGAFKTIDVKELLNKQQLQEKLVLARDAGRVFEVPGQSR